MAQQKWKKLGEILIAQKLITNQQLAQGLDEHRRTGTSLGTMLVKLGHISQEDLTDVLGEQIQISQHKLLGEILIEQDLLSETQLNEGIEDHKKSGEQIGRCLIKLGYISEDRLVDVLAAQLDIPHVMLDNFIFDKKLLNTITEVMARQHKVIPLYETNGVLTVAMAEPSNLRVMDIIKFKTGKEIEPVIASENKILSAIDRNFGSNVEQMSDLLLDMNSMELDVVKEVEEPEVLTAEEGAQIIRIVNAIITQAISERASDIHFEPMLNHVRLRNRIDGVLIERNPIPLQLRAQITSRLKIMAGMDIAERRKPQDGRFQVRHEARMIDIRVSTFPTIIRGRGVNEKVVLRILDSESSSLELKDLGFEPEMLARIEKIILNPNGIILVTGPTGSGKSSSLYGILQQIYTVSRNIVTMEDPVEYYLDGISQAQINTRAGFTFADGIRSILRQDPDVIMVGEMRDRETSEMAIQAALTGHLVLSTLHTNTAIAAFTRLRDMGLEPYLLTATVIGVLAQRLLRKLCPRCKEEYEPEPEMLQRLGLPEDTLLHRAQGCRACQESGYKGRLGVFELLIPDDEIFGLIMQGASNEDIRKYLDSQGTSSSLRFDGLKKAVAGLTTLEQVLVATPDS